jgi:6-phosphogluconolactonase
MTGVRIFRDADELAIGVADEIVRVADRAIENREVCTLLLAGGSTPRSVYARLASKYSGWSGWSKVVIGWGDERCVPAEHADSNFRMAHESLLAHVPVHAGNIYRMPGELPRETGAALYESSLRNLFVDQNAPRFDLILLGMGEDGHTASLFPGSPALDESGHWVVSVAHEQPPLPLVPRLTITFPVINAARNVLLLVSGANKASTLTQVFNPQPSDRALLPVQRIELKSGTLTWMLDASAAKDLDF